MRTQNKEAIERRKRKKLLQSATFGMKYGSDHGGIKAISRSPESVESSFNRMFLEPSER